MSRLRIFISSVQKELAAERRAIRRRFSTNPELTAALSASLVEHLLAKSRCSPTVSRSGIPANFSRHSRPRSSAIDEAHHCMEIGGEDRDASLRRRLAEVLARRSDMFTEEQATLLPNPTEG